SRTRHRAHTDYHSVGLATGHRIACRHGPRDRGGLTQPWRKPTDDLPAHNAAGDPTRYHRWRALRLHRLVRRSREIAAARWARAVDLADRHAELSRIPD